MRLIPVISLLWAGILLGTSFLATPAKFLAPSLSLSGALEVGKVTFTVLSWVEYGLFIALGISLFLYMRSLNLKPIQVNTLLILILLVLFQQTWLLPELDIRTSLIIKGEQLGPSNLHFIYVTTELLKIIVLIVLATASNNLLQQRLLKKEFYYE